MLVCVFMACDSRHAAAPGSGTRSASGVLESDIPADQSTSGLTRQGNFWVRATPLPTPVPFQSLFAMRLEVFEAKARGEAALGVTVDQVDAVMPSHNHGMKVEPVVTKEQEGVFLIQGMRFHMRGDGDDGLWVLQAVLRQGDTVDQTALRFQCCKE